MKNSYKPYGITTISCLPVRQEPDHKSEMCSQLLFGESYQCLSMKDHWIEIKCLLDQTIGWISLDSYVGQDEPGPSLTKNPVYIAAQMVTLVQEDCCNYPFTILPGSTLPCRP